MKPILIYLCLTIAISSAWAEEALPVIELKRKSSFSASDARNPFWPIGWKKPNAKDPNAAGLELSAGSFALTSVTMGAGTHFAILNGKIIQEGQQFGVQFGKQIYQVTLKAIEDGQIILRYQENEIIVPLRRK